MHPHDNWLELAALDAIGELTDQEHDALQAHLRECAECRATAAAEASVARHWLPPASTAQPAKGTADEERCRREAFLSRARGEGLRFSAAAAREPSRWAIWAAGWNTAPVGAVAAMAVLVLVTGAVLWTRPVAPAAATVISDRPEEVGTRVADLARENEQLQRELDVTRSRSQAEREQLAAVQSQSEETRKRVAQLEQWLASAQEQSSKTREELARAKTDASEASQRVAAELQQLDTLRTQLEQVKSAHAADRATLLARQDQVEDLTRQMRLQAASVERAKSLLTANRDIRDLMTARNLHIVDVHDTNAKGKTQKAFGRMFYTEGKSLIFYAYDLESPRLSNASFQVWGQKSGNSEQAVSLGMLYSDDQAQQRWVMTFNDPKVLKEIDSVFVTVEAPGGSTKPSNQRMMYAYLLTQANHQ
jgi:hypothetical protein